MPIPNQPAAPSPAGSETEVTLGFLMMPADANHLGNVHGGVILRLADQVAAVCACRFSRRNCVTASVDRVSFRSPIHVHDLVTLHARVCWTGRTSIEVGVDILAEDLQTGEVIHTNTCRVTMVAVDDRMHPVPVPRFTPRTPEEEEAWREAEARHARRQEKGGGGGTGPT